MNRRLTLVAAASILFAPTMALADASIAGQWQADLNNKVSIVMDVLADGHWTSKTVQNNKVVAEMAGTYEQKKTNSKSGTLVFTPVKSKVSQEHGAAQVETDKYSLQQGGQVLRLASSNNDVMDFHKQAYAH